MREKVAAIVIIMRHVASWIFTEEYLLKSLKKRKKSIPIFLEVSILVFILTE